MASFYLHCTRTLAPQSRLPQLCLGFDFPRATASEMQAGQVRCVETSLKTHLDVWVRERSRFFACGIDSQETCKPDYLRGALRGALRGINNAKSSFSGGKPSPVEDPFAARALSKILVPSVCPTLPTVLHSALPHRRRVKEHCTCKPRVTFTKPSPTRGATCLYCRRIHLFVRANL